MVEDPNDQGDGQADAQIPQDLPEPPDPPEAEPYPDAFETEALIESDRGSHD
jgi:hypothetical protein